MNGRLFVIAVAAIAFGVFIAEVAMVVLRTFVYLALAILGL